MPTNNSRRALTPPDNWEERFVPVTPAPPLPPVQDPLAPFRYSPIQIAPAPTSLATQPDSLQNWVQPTTSQRRIFAPQPAASIAAGSIVKTQVDPVTNVAAKASTTATAAKTTANTANSNSTVAVAGVTTINGHTAVAIVSGVLQQIPISTLGSTTTTPTQDNLNDGTTYNRVLATALTSNAVDTTKAGVLAADGCFPSSIVGTTAAIFAYTSTTTSVTITWSAITVFFANGSTRSIGTGNKTITGLTASTTYYYYPYFSNGGSSVIFVATTGSSGSPGILYTPQSPGAAQLMNLQIVTAMATSGIPVITPSSGSGGGSGGGSGLCVRSTMLVKCKERGIVSVREIHVGDHILGRTGWTEVMAHKVVPQKHFIKLSTTEGSVQLTPTHHITTMDERSVPVANITLMDFLISREGYAQIKTIELVEDPLGRKVVLTCEPEHTFFAGAERPSILVSNSVPIS